MDVDESKARGMVGTRVLGALKPEKGEERRREEVDLELDLVC